MSYTTFNRREFDATKEPMFMGESVNVARYDLQKYRLFERLIERQLSFFWRPEEVDVSQDRIDFQSMPAHEQHIFVSNLRYQTLLDSVQGRSPNMAFLPLASIPELETWIETWSFSETIHSRSYTHIVRNIVNDPSVVFDDIIRDEAIIKRAISVTENYDQLIQLIGLHTSGAKNYHTDQQFRKQVMKATYLCLASVNILEAVRFYVSFACTFAFAERQLMEGNAKIIKMIARDESLHCHGTQEMMKLIITGKEGDDWKAIAEECKGQVEQMFVDAANQEMDWADYLFKDGSMIGLNADILKQYVKHRTNLSCKRVGLSLPYPEIKHDPLPWMDSWLLSDQVQVAPQEAEISSYLVGQVDSEVSTQDLVDFSL